MNAFVLWGLCRGEASAIFVSLLALLLFPHTLLYSLPPRGARAAATPSLHGFARATVQGVLHVETSSSRWGEKV